MAASSPPATADHHRPPPSLPKNFFGELFLRTPKTLLPTGSTRSTTPLATTRRHHLQNHSNSRHTLTTIHHSRAIPTTAKPPSPIHHHHPHRPQPAPTTTVTVSHATSHQV
nr:hypothetical protein [Tanacetum cinerariifolium]